MEKSSWIRPGADAGVLLRRFCLPVLLLALSAEAEVEFSGYARSDAILFDRSLQLPKGVLSRSSLRLMLDAYADRTAWQLHYEVTPLWFSEPVAASFNTDDPREPYRISDLEGTLAAGRRHLLIQNLDRLNLRWSLERGDLTIGRQPITFGAARVINPSDIFLPFDVRTLNTEYRVGVDAIRFQAPLGELSELDIGWVTGRDGHQDSSAFYMQSRGNLAGADISGSVMHYAGQTLTGVGLERALGKLGFWFEAAYTTGDTDYSRLSTGLDHAFNGQVFGLIEYHYNGAGKDRASDYPSTARETPYQTGGVFLLGKHYLITALTVQASPLITLGLQAIANLADQSSFLHLSLAWSLTDNLFLDAGLQLYSGRTFNEETELFRSEYGDAPDNLYLSFRYYF